MNGDTSLAPRALSDEAVDWLLGLKESALPKDVHETTRLRILDVIGLILAVCDRDIGRTMRRAAGEIAIGDCTILGTDDTAAPIGAALANGTMASALDYDDTHLETILHFSSPIVSTAFAVAEHKPINGSEILTAIAGASELTCRLGMIAPGEFHRRQFHSTAILAAFGSAWVAGRLMGLKHQTIVSSIGIIGSEAAGTTESLNDGTNVRFTHSGWAAQCGIASSIMARAGITGPARVVEGSRGIFASHIQQPTKPFAFDSFLAGLGTRWEARRSSFKPYPCGHVIHAFIDALLYLRRAHNLTAEMIEKIVCPAAEFMIPMVCEPAAEKLAPKSDTVARVSLQYTLAEAMTRGRLGADAYDASSLKNPAILALARRIEFVIDKDAPGRERYQGWVQIKTKDGRAFERIEPHNRGSVERPLSVNDVREKFLDNSRPVIGTRAEALADLVLVRFHKLESIDELLVLCRPANH